MSDHLNRTLPSTNKLYCNGIRELLAWFDQAGSSTFMPEEIAQQGTRRADVVQPQANRVQLQAALTQRQADRLVLQLCALGIDPDF
jgi:hypothetical protein